MTGWHQHFINLAVEYVMRQMEVGRSNTLISKTMQLAAQADYINIMSRTFRGAQKTYSQLNDKASWMGLQISEQKKEIYGTKVEKCNL